MPCSSTTLSPFDGAIGATSMYAIRTSWPSSVNGKYDTGCGYGTSSRLMLIGPQSAGGDDGGSCADARLVLTRTRPPGRPERATSDLCASLRMLQLTLVG